jgi:hypothetical protein
VSRRLAQDRPPFAVQVEQAVAFRRDRVAIESLDTPAWPSISNLKVGVLPFEQRGLARGALVRVELVEPGGDSLDPSAELQPRMPGGRVSAIESVSQKAQPSPLRAANTSTSASISRAAPVVRVASKGWKYRPGSSVALSKVSNASPCGP